MADATDPAAGCVFLRRKSRGVSRPDDDGGLPVTQLGSRFSFACNYNFSGETDTFVD
jgi:hypothetical protein